MKNPYILTDAQKYSLESSYLKGAQEDLPTPNASQNNYHHSQWVRKAFGVCKSPCALAWLSLQKIIRLAFRIAIRFIAMIVRGAATMTATEKT